MHRLYMYVVAALQDHGSHVGIGFKLFYDMADTGDEISEKAHARAKATYPESDGFMAHRVMIVTVGDEAVNELVEYRLKVAIEKEVVDGEPST